MPRPHRILRLDLDSPRERRIERLADRRHRLRHLPQGDGPFRDRRHRGHRARRRRPFGITVNALSSVSLDPPLVMVALDRRRFLTPIVRAAGRYAGQHPVRGPAGAVGLLRRRRGRARPRGVLRGGLAARVRPGCRSSTARSRRSSARSSRPSRRATTTCSSGASTRSPTSITTRCRCSTTGAATCASSAPRAPRSRASRSGSIGRPCRRSAPTTSTSATRSAAPAHRWSSLHGAATTGRDTFGRPAGRAGRRVPGLPARRARSRPDPLGRRRRLPRRLAGRRPQAFADALGLSTFHLVGYLDGRR